MIGHRSLASAVLVVGALGLSGCTAGTTTDYTLERMDVGASAPPPGMLSHTGGLPLRPFEVTRSEGRRSFVSPPALSRLSAEAASWCAAHAPGVDDSTCLRAYWSVDRLRGSERTVLDWWADQGEAVLPRDVEYVLPRGEVLGGVPGVGRQGHPELPVDDDPWWTAQAERDPGRVSGDWWREYWPQYEVPVEHAVKLGTDAPVPEDLGADGQPQLPVVHDPDAGGALRFALLPTLPTISGEARQWCEVNGVDAADQVGCLRAYWTPQRLKASARTYVDWAVDSGVPVRCGDAEYRLGPGEQPSLCDVQLFEGDYWLVAESDPSDPARPGLHEPSVWTVALPAADDPWWDEQALRDPGRVSGEWWREYWPDYQPDPPLFRSLVGGEPGW